MPLLSAVEAARLLGVSPSWVRRQARRGLLPYLLRVGRRYWFSVPMLRQWQETHPAGSSRGAS